MAFHFLTLANWSYSYNFFSDGEFHDGHRYDFCKSKSFTYHLKIVTTFFSQNPNFRVNLKSVWSTYCWSSDLIRKKPSFHPDQFVTDLVFLGFGIKFRFFKYCFRMIDSQRIIKMIIRNSHSRKLNFLFLISFPWFLPLSKGPKHFVVPHSYGICGVVSSEDEKWKATIEACWRRWSGPLNFIYYLADVNQKRMRKVMLLLEWC